MKILLVQPPSPPGAIAGDDWFVFEPLALEYLAAGVVDDHEVKILDLRLNGSLRDTLDAFQPDMVGVTAYTVHVNTVRHLCETVKRWNARTLTVVGGHHATVAPHDFALPSIDLTVMGEGVHAFRKIVSRFESNDGFEKIPGVATATTPAGQLDDSVPFDLDTLPPPERTLTTEYRSQYFCDWMRPLASIRTSKGCAYRCRFCALWKLTCGKYLRRAPETVVQELAGIDEENVFFADDESLLDGKRMKTLAHLIDRAGIHKRYFLYGRSDTIARSPDLLEAWRKIGLTRVFVGLEFVSDEDLQFVGKQSTKRDNERAIEILHALDIDIYASFMLRPDFERRHFRQLRGYCRALKLDYPSFAVLTPLPGTDLYEEVKDELITRNYDYFDLIHTLLATRLPLDQFYKQYAWLINTVLTPRQKFSFLRRFPLRELGPTIVRSMRIQKRVRNAWKDYGRS
jgi:radical SAM superfamily enzyme YgiQ (UPF0313 family)